MSSYSLPLWPDSDHQKEFECIFQNEMNCHFLWFWHFLSLPLSDYSLKPYFQYWMSRCQQSMQNISSQTLPKRFCLKIIFKINPNEIKTIQNMITGSTLA